MATRGTVAKHIIDTLQASGVHRVYGLPGDSLNGVTDAIRQDDGVTWTLTRHEEAAAFAASAEAALTGELAVCAGSCGVRVHVTPSTCRMASATPLRESPGSP